MKGFGLEKGGETDNLCDPFANYLGVQFHLMTDVLVVVTSQLNGGCN